MGKTALSGTTIPRMPSSLHLWIATVDLRAGFIYRALYRVLDH